MWNGDEIPSSSDFIATTTHKSVQKHSNIHTIQGDVTSKEDLARAVSTIKSAHGYINVLIANSGISGPTLQKLPPNPSITEYQKFLLSRESDDFNQTYAVNTTGVFNSVAAFLELLDLGNKKGNVQQRSQIIATSSIGGFNRIPIAGYAYAGSKAAATHMIKQFSTAFGIYNIRANVLAPGCKFLVPLSFEMGMLTVLTVYLSEMTEEFFKDQGDKPFPKSVVPEERLGNAQDLAGAALFLTSKAGAYINGNVLVTDGGRLGVLPSSY
jgi:NAD(P)-dependent dehydrogenase (short-subunit alcohol dehydrogenase family)